MAKTTNFKPAIGDLFMMSYESGDRSYQENVFRVLDCDDRITIGEMIVGHSFKFTPHVFLNKEVTFYEISEERALLLEKKSHILDDDEISEEEIIERLTRLSIDVGYPSTTTVSSNLIRKVLEMLKSRPIQNSNITGGTL